MAEFLHGLRIVPAATDRHSGLRPRFRAPTATVKRWEHKQTFRAPAATDEWGAEAKKIPAGFYPTGIFEKQLFPDSKLQNVRCLSAFGFWHLKRGWIETLLDSLFVNHDF